MPVIIKIAYYPESLWKYIPNTEINNALWGKYTQLFLLCHVTKIIVLS